MPVEQEAVDEAIGDVPDSEEPTFQDEPVECGLALVESVAGDAGAQELVAEEEVGEAILDQDEEGEDGCSQVGLVGEYEGESCPELSSRGEGQVEQVLADHDHGQEPEQSVALEGSQH